MSWDYVTLGEVATVGAGNSAPQDEYLFVNGLHNFYRTSDVGRIRNGFISDATDKLNGEGIKGLKIHPKGTILFPKSGASTFLNHRVMLEKEGYVSSHLATIKANNEKLDDRFLLYFLTTIDAKTLVQDSNYPSLKTSVVEKIRTPLPSLTTQYKLVAKLDAIFAQIDKATAAAETNAKNAEALFQSYLNQVFEKGGLGWTTTVLDKVCKVDRGSSPRPIKDYFTDSDDGVNWIKIGDTEEGGKYIFSTNQKITKVGAEKSRYVEVGDFILTNSMSYGRPYIMRINGYIHDGWFVLRLNKDIDSEYFYYLLTSPYVQKQFKSLAAGSVVKNISGDLVKKTILPIPSTAEQKKLAEIFSEKQVLLKRLTDVYFEKKNDLSLLKNSILKKAFNGELFRE